MSPLKDHNAFDLSRSHPPRLCRISPSTPPLPLHACPCTNARYKKSLEECREAMGEIVAMIDREGASEKINIFGFALTYEFRNQYLSLVFTVMVAVLIKYCELD